MAVVRTASDHSRTTKRNVRRRIRGKTPPPLVVLPEESPFPSDVAQSSGGYYGILGIARTATAEEVRHAYRKKALAVHPDKLFQALGRQPSKEEVRRAERDYIGVTSAFDVLSDEKLRRQYDAQFFPWPAPDLGGQDSQSFAEADPQTAAREARLIVQDVMLECCDVDVAELAGLGTSVLMAMRNFLNGGRPACGEQAKCSQKKLDPHLTFRQAQGYTVKVKWAAMTVTTTCTWSLEQALAWRSALTFLQNRAKSRLREFEAQSPEGGPVQPIVLKEEISDVLRMEPDLRLSFCCYLRATGRSKLYTPTTANWRLALTQKLAFAEAVQTGRSAQLSRAQLEAKMAVDRDKQESRQRCARLLTLVLEELDRRLHEVDQRRRDAERQATLIGQMRNEFHVTRQAAAAALELQSMLGLETAEIGASLTRLRQLHPQELRRRAKALFGPARALPAPPQPRHSPRPRSPAPSNGAASLEGLARPLRPSEPSFREWCGGPAVSEQEFLRKDVVVRMLCYFDCIELDCFRAAARSSRDAGEHAYWDRCRVFSCSSDVIGGTKFSSKGRRLAPKATSSSGPMTLAVAFLSQPRLAAYFEHLQIKFSGSEVLKSDKLLPAISKMLHLQRVELPASGWDDSCTRNRFLLSLQRQGIRVQFAS